MTAVQVRAWTEPEGGWPARRRHQAAHPSRYLLAFDTETVDPGQRFLLLVWRLYVDGALVTEGIAHPDGLRGKRLAMLRDYVTTHQADTEPWARRNLMLVPLSEWVAHHLHRYGYSNRAAVVGYNLPFDIGTIAGADWTAARSGGFTFRLAPRYTAATGREQKVWHRPDLKVQHIDNGAFIEWTGCVTGERDHASGRRWRKGESRTGTTPYRGRFVDCSTLHFALTGSHASLEGACGAWGVDTGKIDATFGVLDEALVDHCRADVAMTAELHQVLTVELAQHPGIKLADDALWSPATVAGRYLDAMRLSPLLDRLGVPAEVHAAARCASYGARTEARIVRAPMPVVALDVASMYPTVSALLGTWGIWTAARVAVDDRTDELAAWLASPGLEDDLYDPTTWRRWGATLVEVEPAGDVLPHQFVDDADKGRLVTAALRFGGRMWWSWPDVAAAVLLGDKVPTITRTLHLRPEGRQLGLRAVQLRSDLRLDPRRADPFPFLVAARHQADEAGEAHLARFYKIAANALAHGLSGRYDHKGRHHQAMVHGPAGSAAQRVRMEQPGPHAFPAISSTTTAGARLVLAMMERATTDAGGCWAHCDTDSAKIVATPTGGLIACPGGPHRITLEPPNAEGAPSTPAGAGIDAEGATAAVRALSWEQVATIADRFAPLAPEGSRRPFWTVEHESLTRPLTALVTGPKSYALFRLGDDGGIELTFFTETHLGESYLAPERAWSADAWRWTIGRALGRLVDPPAWWGTMALRREAAVNPIMARAAEASGVAARPFGFRLAATAWGGGAAPVAPYSRNPADWTSLDWRDRNDGRALRLDPEAEDELALPGGLPGERLYVQPGTLGQVVRRVAAQAVPTFNDPATGEPADRKAKGLLRRRTTVADHLVLVGADRTPIAASGEGPDQRYPTCRRCRKPLDGQASQQFCSDACEHAGRRQRAKQAAPPEAKRTCAWSGCSTVLTSRQPEWCAEHRKRGAMRAMRDRRRPGHRCEQPGCHMWLADPDGAFPYCSTHVDPGSRMAPVVVEAHPCAFEGCLTSIAGDPEVHPYCVAHKRAMAGAERREALR